LLNNNRVKSLNKTKKRQLPSWAQGQLTKAMSALTTHIVPPCERSSNRRVNSCCSAVEKRNLLDVGVAVTRHLLSLSACGRVSDTTLARTLHPLLYIYDYGRINRCSNTSFRAMLNAAMAGFMSDSVQKVRTSSTYSVIAAASMDCHLSVKNKYTP